VPLGPARKDLRKPPAISVIAKHFA